MATEALPQHELVGFDQVEDGTVFWTVSFYIAAEDLSRELGTEHNAETWRTFVKDHDCSLLLGSAIDPLFNDIADRDIRGAVQDFLISAHDCDEGFSADWARERVLSEEKVTFLPPKQIGWTTEGIRFNASPMGLDAPRETEMKRFWFAHHGGALSYHLSFKYRYSFDENNNSADPAPRIAAAYSPATFYFLSALQKLVAPKELPLSPEELHKALGEAKTNPDGSQCPPHRDVFASPTTIDLLDDFRVRGLAPNANGDLETRFWEGIRQRFEADAGVLLKRLRKQLPRTAIDRDAPLIHRLLPTHPMIEVPGLGIPRCRYMFFFRDKRFFDRLLPPFAGEPRTRQMLVPHDSYRHYAALLSTRIRAVKQEMRKPPAQRRGAVTVELDPDFWSQVADNPSQLSDNLRRDDDQADDGRADCLDYLFLSGFIQNIVDFMNQDVSEILDSTDPIYPDDETQANERFFVRFANHRAMTTFVEASRSLEVGNDYIGTCPYAFLIHILAMHNEYLDRIQEREIGEKIEQIARELDELDREDKKAIRVSKISEEIDKAKRRYTRTYDSFRYHNPFRYDTEFAVFKKLEGLRGSERKREIQKTALANLEDQASDVQLLIEEEQHQLKEAERDRQEKRDKRLNLGFTVIGLSSLLSLMYSMSTFHIDKCTLFSKVNPNTLLEPSDWMKTSLIVEHLSILLIFAVLLYLLIVLIDRFSKHANLALRVFVVIGVAIVAADLYRGAGVVIYDCATTSATKPQPG